jgi:hypothetical protein
MAGEFRRHFFVIFQRLNWKILPGGRQFLPIGLQHKEALKDDASVPSAGRRAIPMLESVTACVAAASAKDRTIADWTR